MKLKNLCFILWRICANLSIRSIYAMYDDALVLAQTRKDLEFAKPGIDSEGEFMNYDSSFKTLLYLCPSEQKYILNIVQQIDIKHYGLENKICTNPLESSILRVEWEWKNYQGETYIHQYHAGFLIHDAKVRDIKRYIDYKLLNNESSDFYFIPMVEIYRNINSQHTIAIRYETLQVDVQKQLAQKSFEFYNPSNLFPDDKIEQLHKNQKTKLKELLGQDYNPDKHVLIIDSLVNENDFLIDTWKKTTHYKAYQILLWSENLQMWRNIREFVRHLANLTNIEVTAGIGKPLKITNLVNSRQFKMNWGEQEKHIFIPDLYWVAVRYIRNGRMSGMFIIMHNELIPNSAQKSVQKLCNENYCVKNKIWNLKEEYKKLEEIQYCCPISAQIITELGVEFLLQPQNFFKGFRNISFPPQWNVQA